MAEEDRARPFHARTKLASGRLLGDARLLAEAASEARALGLDRVAEAAERARSSYFAGA